MPGRLARVGIASFGQGREGRRELAQGLAQVGGNYTVTVGVSGIGYLTNPVRLDPAAAG